MVTSTQVIDPLSIATQGFVSGLYAGQQIEYVNALAVATMGWIVFIEESIVEVATPEFEFSGGRRMRPKKATKRKKRKRFVVTVEIRGRLYAQTKYTEDLTITAKDVIVSVKEQDGKPKLTVTLPERQGE